MGNNIKSSILLLFLCSCLITLGQQKKPKVALVLSGGGAKGIAHVPTLQALDSLGIVPDLIIGTSMGSIVGAMYASGYSADSIAYIAKSTDWGELFSSDIPVTSVTNEEKSEYKRYLFKYSLDKNKTSAPTSMISDQNLNAFFNEVTYPVNGIKDFNNLPIPFKAVTTDIVNGREVVLDKGSLSFAMRSSMSIPAVFAPMKYKDVLLIDGGVLNNFPTDIAKEWGADIIIGSDVGGGMEPIEKLDNPINIVMQSAMLASNLKVPENKKLCDVLIDHALYLTHSTGSFGKGDEIFEEGKIATNENMDKLIAISNRLKNYKQRKPILPKVANEIVLDTIIYEGISKSNMALFKSRINITLHNSYTLKEIREASDIALGTNLFKSISFHLFHKNGTSGLKVTATEKSQHLLKGSLHFDDYRGIGLFVNYTGRNVIGKSSRVLLSLDISDDIRYRAQYQINFGKEKNWWFRSDLYGETLDQRTYISGEYAGDLNSEHLQFDNQFNLNINSFKNYVGIGLTYDWNRLEPKIDPSLSENIYALTSYDFKNFDIYAHYVQNNLNQVYYATKGSLFKVKLSTSLDNNMMAETLELPKTEGLVSLFTKFRYTLERRIPINKKLTTILNLTGGYSFFNDNGVNFDYSLYGYAAQYSLGGNIERPRNDMFKTMGLEENELTATQFTMLNISLQYKPLEDIYFTPHATIASVGFNDIKEYGTGFFTPKGQWAEGEETSLLTTFGLTASYNSILGPVDLDISWTNHVSGPRYFFGVGYHFNP